MLRLAEPLLLARPLHPVQNLRERVDTNELPLRAFDVDEVAVHALVVWISLEVLRVPIPVIRREQRSKPEPRVLESCPRLQIVQNVLIDDHVVFEA